jgi:F-type H+-transporting ATPase subunit gamma
MTSLKDIRKRIVSVKSTQKITRAMKMVAGARLNRAQQRITELRPYAVKTQQVLSEVTASWRSEMAQALADADDHVALHSELLHHPLLTVRPEKHVELVVLTSDRGLCGSFNSAITKAAEQEWRNREAAGQEVTMLVIGRKGRDYFARRDAPMTFVPGVWDDLSAETAKSVGRQLLEPFVRPSQPVDAIYLVYNEFKSAISQKVTVEQLLPVSEPTPEEALTHEEHNVEFLFEPSEAVLLEQLVPRHQQRQRHDCGAHAAVQPRTPSRHHQGADGDHRRQRGAQRLTPSADATA